jgi:hypothetical protein
VRTSAGPEVTPVTIEPSSQYPIVIALGSYSSTTSSSRNVSSVPAMIRIEPITPDGSHNGRSRNSASGFGASAASAPLEVGE